MISVIIPTYNRGDLLYKCLNSVVDSINASDEIIVVNDFKDKDIDLHKIERKDKSITIVNNLKKGVASARNYGASYAKGDVLLFIDDDMLVNKQAVENSLTFIQSHPESIINADWSYSDEDLNTLKNELFGRYLIYIGFTSLKGWNKEQNWHHNTFFLTNGITSQFLMISKNCFYEIGCYDENFPFAGFEDAALLESIQKSNLKCYINSIDRIIHNEKDRMTVHSYLERKKRGSFTRIIGVELGYKNFMIKYSKPKVYYYKTLRLFKSLLLKTLTLIPNKVFFDPTYRFIMNRLVGIYIYEGYFKINISKNY